jgi:hypothetical protein
MKPRVEPCPSPNGTNKERLYLVKLPRSTPAGALDAALRKVKDRKDGYDDQPEEQERDLTALRGKLEQFLSQVLPDSHYQSALDLLTEAGLPESKTYGVEDEEPEHKYPDREQMRKYLQGQGFADDDIEEAISKMPRSAIEGGMGGRTSEADDRRRGARDRRRMAGDSAADSFERMFGASRIKGAL